MKHYLALKQNIVDDLIVAATEASMIENFEKQLNKVLVLKNLENCQYYLGLQFERDQEENFYYTSDILSENSRLQSN
jgi:hypothetical protein